MCALIYLNIVILYKTQKCSEHYFYFEWPVKFTIDALQTCIISAFTVYFFMPLKMCVTVA